MNDGGYSQRAIKQALQIYVAFKTANLFLAFVFQVIVAKTLSPASFATYAVLLAILMAGERALSLGIDRTILRFIPALRRNNDFAGVRAVIARVALLRMAALIVFVASIVLGGRVLNSIVPTQLTPEALLAFAVWFVAYTLTADLDAFAQSCLAHYNSALGATLEIVARISALFGLLWWLPVLSVENILTILAITFSCSVIFVGYRLRGIIKALTVSSVTVAPRADTTFDPTRGPIFALANFASTISYLISSPPVVRIMATLGLNVVALAAFSFSQGLFISLQRIFPGQLILPTLESVIMSQVAGDIRGDKVNAGLSLLFKMELICILSAVIVTSIAGADIVSILSRPAYASYYYVLPILIGSLVLITSYRLFELIANTHFKQHLFFWLWPLSALAMLAMYATVRNWGLLSVLFWPIAEIALRMSILAFLLRKCAIRRAFDPSRSIPVILSATAITLCLCGLRSLVPMHFYYSDMVLAAAGLLVFLGSFFLLRPIRQNEYDALVNATPASLTVVRRIALLASRRQHADAYDS